MFQKFRAAISLLVCFVLVAATFDPTPNDPPTRTGGTGTRIVPEGITPES